MKFKAYPADRHDRILSALPPSLDGMSNFSMLSTDHTLDGYLSDEGMPHAFLGLVPPALHLSNYLPTFDLDDSPSNEKKEAKYIKEAAAWWRMCDLENVMTKVIMESAAYGVAYIVVYDDGIEWAKHDAVEFSPSWEKRDIVKVSWVKIVDDQERTLIHEFDAVKGKFKAYYKDTSDYIIETHKIDCIPVVRLEFGVNPSDYDFPFGLILPWLNILYDLNTYKAILKMYTVEHLGQRYYVDGSYMKNAERGIEINLHGRSVIGMPAGFFDHTGKGKIWKPPAEYAPPELYQHIMNLEKKLAEVSHISDLLKASELRKGITATEVAVMNQNQTVWITNLRSIVIKFTEDLWKIWARNNNIDVEMSIEIPDIDPSSVEEKNKKVQVILQTMQMFPDKVNIDEGLFEVGKLLGISNLLKKVENSPQAPTQAKGENMQLVKNLESLFGADAPKILELLQQLEVVDQAAQLQPEQLQQYVTQLLNEIQKEA